MLERLDDDIAMINTRLLGANLRLDTSEHVVTLVHTNASRSEINRNALLNAAAQLPPGDIVCIKGDISASRGGRAPSDPELELLHDIDDSKESNNLSPTLFLYIGQRVSVTENVATALGAANGTQGVVIGVKFADDIDGVSSTELRDVTIAGVVVRATVCNVLPELVFVQLINNAPGVCALVGLPPNVFAFSPVTKSVTVTVDRRKLTFRLTQFGLVPCAAVTLHKVQGQSLVRAIIGLWRDPKMVAQNAQTAYVALSRLRTLAGLYFTVPLTREDCEHFVPSLDIIDELVRLDALQPAHLQTSNEELARRRAPAAARAAARRGRRKPTRAMRRAPARSPAPPPPPNATPARNATQLVSAVVGARDIE